MEAVTIHLAGQRGITRIREPLTVGVPLQKGAVRKPDELALLSPTGDCLPADFSPALYWPDGSIRWLRVATLIDLTPESSDKLLLVTRTGAELLPASSLTLSQDSSHWTIDTGKLQLRFDDDQLAWTASPTNASSARVLTSHTPAITDKAGHPCHAVMTHSWSVADTGIASITLEARGQWVTTDSQTFAHFHCRVTCFNESETIEIAMVLHNTRRAQHRGGLWDLGDPGSIHIRSQSLTITPSESGTPWLQPEAGTERQQASSGSEAIVLYQDSSGGEQWNSPNHLDAQMDIVTRFRGYQVTEDGQLITDGHRARPIAGITGPSPVQVGIRQFWENFPGSVKVTPGALSINLLPPESSGLHELQGGERKTRTLWLNYSDDHQALQWTRAPLIPTLDARQFEQAKAFPWFTADLTIGPLESLIQAGVEGPGNFFEKRETIDEYGWRNFGDLFADHETLYQPECEPPLVSHYNNQYDAIYGFARQFAANGDVRWFNLMDDLARHVVDIDIYHTDEDRSEYNHGLFWHTDHYLNAHTCTHRTFSQHNRTSSTPGQTGGGPGAEHCYTTGLLYHYLLTGNVDSRRAVLGLSNWMRNLHEGNGGLLEQLLAIKKRDLPKLKTLIRGGRPTAHQYPFTRGTGNYINALLDAWQLEPSRDWLFQLETVIRNTMNPGDDIQKRDLLDVETGWSYLILLASLARYLKLKELLSVRDEHYQYARECFQHYTHWIAENERPFLAVPEQLEFANDTWVAQDIRKSMLLFQAAEYTDDHGLQRYYVEKASEWLQETCELLSKSPQRHYTRILVILMQNYGPHQCTTQLPSDASTGLTKTDFYDQKLTLSLQDVVRQITQRLMIGVKSFRLAREKAWLKARLGQR
ncbi:hypothetical protein MLC59_07655 [Marinobacter bryozoorum]|uniref:RIFT barrel domain-containing protein n=1 Tax=Marinobacter bryozoorum TaxID=256324 RepID=UPI0020034FDD|nr:hypothetical protein [Marinobacter bryozoorum]MCK7544041.1 hypothetical protein [Marinobacter bryozoorum]